MSFTIFLNSSQGKKTGLNTADINSNSSVSYNFNFDNVPHHPDGRAGKYKLEMTILTQALATAATATDIAIVTANFNCTKYVYGVNATNTTDVSNFIGYLTPLAYSSSSLISQYVNVPIYMTKPENNTFTIEMKDFAGDYYTRLGTAQKYIMNVTFTAV